MGSRCVALLQRPRRGPARPTSRFRHLLHRARDSQRLSRRPNVHRHRLRRQAKRDRADRRLATGLRGRRLHVLGPLDRCRPGGCLCPDPVAEWAGAGVVDGIAEATDALGEIALRQKSKTVYFFELLFIDVLKTLTPANNCTRKDRRRPRSPSANGCLSSHLAPERADETIHSSRQPDLPHPRLLPPDHRPRNGSPPLGFDPTINNDDNNNNRCR